MATNFTMPSMFDTRYAMDRQMETDAMTAATNLGGGNRGGMYYNSSLGGDTRNAGLMSLAGLFGGGGDPRMQKQMAIDSIMQQYPNPETAEDFKFISGALRQSGLYEEADRAMSMANEIVANQPKPAEPTADIKNFNKAVEQGYTGSFFDYQRALKSGSKQVSIGSVPQDFIITTNELGEITMEVIPGSPTDKANKKAEEVKGEGAARKAVQSSVVIEDIGRLTDAIKNDSFLDPASSSILSYILENPIIGSGKNRIDAVSLATTIKSSIGFDRLQQMREESPTGGALGQVSELELVTLQATLGSLDLNQSKENILYNLERLEEIYVQIFTKLQAYPNFEKYFGESVVSDSAEEIVENDDPLGIR